MAFIDDIVVTFPAEAATNVEGIDDVTSLLQGQLDPLLRHCSPKPSRVLDPLAVGDRPSLNSLGTNVSDTLRQTGLTVSKRVMGVVGVPLGAES